MAPSRPTFQWHDQHGQPHQRTSTFRTSPAPAPGKQLPVLFDPNNPSRAMMDTFSRNGKAFFVIGAVVIGAALAENLILMVLILAG